METPETSHGVETYAEAARRLLQRMDALKNTGRRTPVGPGEEFVPRASPGLLKAHRPEDCANDNVPWVLSAGRAVFDAVVFAGDHTPTFGYGLASPRNADRASDTQRSATASETPIAEAISSVSFPV